MNWLGEVNELHNAYSSDSKADLVPFLINVMKLSTSVWGDAEFLKTLSSKVCPEAVLLFPYQAHLAAVVSRGSVYGIPRERQIELLKENGNILAILPSDARASGVCIQAATTKTPASSRFVDEKMSHRVNKCNESSVRNSRLFNIVTSRKFCLACYQASISCHQVELIWERFDNMKELETLRRWFKCFREDTESRRMFTGMQGKNDPVPRVLVVCTPNGLAVEKI